MFELHVVRDAIECTNATADVSIVGHRILERASIGHIHAADVGYFVLVQ
jgi:hypothetical protein